MLIEGSSDIVASIQTSEINGQYVELIALRSGQVIALSAQAMTLYKNVAAVGDPLGNGLIHSVDIPTAHHLDESTKPWVMSHSAGFVGLSNTMALLLLPNDIKLYDSKESALYNRAALSTLPLI